MKKLDAHELDRLVEEVVEFMGEHFADSLEARTGDETYQLPRSGHVCSRVMDARILFEGELDKAVRRVVKKMKLNASVKG